MTPDDLSPLLDAWTRWAGLAARLRRYGESGRDHANADLQRLVATRDEASARKLLARAKGWPGSPGSGELNLPRLIDLLLARTITVLGSAGDVEQARPLVGWLSLSAEFSDEHELYGAHALFLTAVGHALTRQRRQGIEALEAALDQYGHLAETFGVQSVAAALLAHLKAGIDESVDTKKRFEQAEALARSLPSADQAWNGFLVRLRRTWEERWRTAERLAADVGPDVDAPGIVIDEEVLGVLESRAVRLAATGKTEAALATGRAAEAVAAGLGQEPSFLDSVGETALGRGAVATAESIARAVAQWHPTRPERRLLLLKVLAKQGKTEEVEREAKSILRAMPDLAEAHLHLGLALMHRRSLDEALSALGRAQELAPQNPNIAHGLALLSPAQLPGIHFAADTGSLTIDPQLMRQAPEELPFLMSAAIIRSRPSEAAASLQAVERESGREFADRVRAYLYPGVPGVPSQEEVTHFERAETLFAARKLPEARAEYLLAIAEEPPNNLAYMGLGDCYFQGGEYNVAAAYFEESLAIAPHPSTYRFLGEAHERCGRKANAIEAYRAALKLKPDYSIARAQLGRLEQLAEDDDAS
jgi:tetratricopeptide (TPR) repeat protein